MQGGQRSRGNALRETRASRRGRWAPAIGRGNSQLPHQFYRDLGGSLAMVVEFFAKTLGKTPAREDFEGLTWGFYQFGKTITAAQYQLCWASLQASSRQVARWQQHYDAWITPVLGRPPLEIGAVDLDE